MSKEMREQIDKVKNFGQLLSEEFKEDTIFYKIVDYQFLPSIFKEGLKPGKDGGTWVIAEENFSDWTKPNSLFGSMLQALLYFPSKRNSKVALLKISTKPTNIKVRNVDLMLTDMKKWKESLIDISDFTDKQYSVNEYLLIDDIGPNKIEIVNMFSVPSEISQFKIEPNSLMDFIFGNGTELKTEEKIKTLNLMLKFIFLKVKEIFKI
jgi:hypothetical protein